MIAHIVVDVAGMIADCASFAKVSTAGVGHVLHDRLSSSGSEELFLVLFRVRLVFRIILEAENAATFALKE